jgi:transketolase
MIFANQLLKCFWLPAPATPQARSAWPTSSQRFIFIFFGMIRHAGYFSVEELKTLRKFGSRLQGHPHREWLPMLETSSGPLGSGLSQAVGMALADIMDNGPSTGRFIFCMMGDGELDEGQNWEAMMLAGREELGNLIAIVDRNHIQIDGFTEQVMPLEPLRDKWEAFNWQVLEMNGHDFNDIVRAVEEAKAEFSRPTVILAHTIAGRGVKEFERKFEWHGKAPNTAEAKMALDELRTLGGKIKSEHQ